MYVFLFFSFSFFSFLFYEGGSEGGSKGGIYRCFRVVELDASGETTLG